MGCKAEEPCILFYILHGIWGILYGLIGIRKWGYKHCVFYGDGGEEEDVDIQGVEQLISFKDTNTIHMYCNIGDYFYWKTNT